MIENKNNCNHNHENTATTIYTFNPTAIPIAIPHCYSIGAHHWARAAMSEEGPPPTRWEVELEFVQGLANPMYVHFLAHQKYLDDPDFLRYLEYLEYWREMPHVQYIAYPNCLTMLTLLQQPEFRKEIARAEVATLIMDGFFRKWQLPQPESEEAVKDEPKEETEVMTEIKEES